MSRVGWTKRIPVFALLSAFALNSCTVALRPATHSLAPSASSVPQPAATRDSTSEEGYTNFLSPQPFPDIDVSSALIPRDVWFVDASTGYGIDSSCPDEPSTIITTINCTSVIRRSSDAGHTWARVGDPLHIPISKTGPDHTLSANVRFTDRNTGWIYGSTLLATRDGGMTWTEEQHPATITRFIPTGNTIWAIAGSCEPATCPSAIYARPIHGTTWRRLTSQPAGLDDPGNIQFVATSPTSAAFLSTSDFSGTLSTTTDGGTTWTTNALPTTDVEMPKLALTGHRFWLMSGRQPTTGWQDTHLYYSDDDGTHWIHASDTGNTFDGGAGSIGNLPVMGDVGDLFALPTGRLFVTREKFGQLFRSDNRGRRWISELPDDGGGGYYGIQFVDPRHGWVRGSQVLFRTVDGGAHWSLVAGTPPT